MLVTCNESCGKNFKLDKFKEKKLKDGVVETYFKCPYCHKIYTCFYTDKEIRKLQSKLRGMWGKTTRQEIEKLQEIIKSKMDGLREKIQSTN